MPRSRGGAGPSRAPSRPTVAPQRQAPAPQQTRPASTAAHPQQQQQQQQQQSGGGSGLFGQMASTAAGVAVGSSIGHAIGGFFGGGSQPVQQAPLEQAPQQLQAQAQGFGPAQCDADARNFTKCMTENNGSMQICGWYLEQLKACQQAAGQY